jgi:hypothetical protein
VPQNPGGGGRRYGQGAPVQGGELTWQVLTEHL